MVRTVISLEEEDKRWLDQRAAEEQISMAEVVRRAVQQYRQQDAVAGGSAFHRLLTRTAGIWKGEDPLDYQLGIRGEWDDR